MNTSIFVFGSNLAGRHGKGAALVARNTYGAQYGIGEGLTGSSYAIPTKDHYLRPRSLENIEKSVKKFIIFAKNNKNLHFIVTKIGCGLAGYSENQIKPMFKDAPANCTLPIGWETNAT